MLVDILVFILSLVCLSVGFILLISGLRILRFSKTPEGKRLRERMKGVKLKDVLFDTVPRRTGDEEWFSQGMVFDRRSGQMLKTNKISDATVSRILKG